MLVEVLKSKIHGAIVTGAKLDYVGSITLDAEFIERAGLVEYEKVLVVNNANGARIETYVIEGERGSREVCLNGAAAHHFAVGNSIIVMAFGRVESRDLLFRTPPPRMIFPLSDGHIATLEEIVRLLASAMPSGIGFEAVVDSLHKSMGLPKHKLRAILEG